LFLEKDIANKTTQTTMVQLNNKLITPKSKLKTIIKAVLYNFLKEAISEGKKYEINNTIVNLDINIL
jgi:ribosomal protein S20